MSRREQRSLAKLGLGPPVYGIRRQRRLHGAGTSAPVVDLSSQLAARSPAFRTWLVLALTAFVLAPFTAIALASGIAWADQGTSGPDGESGGGASTSQQSGADSPRTGASPANNSTPAQRPSTTNGQPPRRGSATTSPDSSIRPNDPDQDITASTPAPAQRAGVQRPSSAAGQLPRRGGLSATLSPGSSVQRNDPGQELTDDTSTNVSASTAPSGTTVADLQHTGTTDAAPSEPTYAGTQPQSPAAADTASTANPPPAAVEDVPDAPAAADPASDPTTPRSLDGLLDTIRSGRSTGAAQPTAGEAPPAAAVAPSMRGVAPKLALVTPSTGGMESPVSAVPSAAIAATDPGPAAGPSAPTPPGPVPFRFPSLPELTGLASDLTTVALSVVHTAATVVAEAFGPDSFLGVPYLLATAVANTAAAAGRTLIGAPITEPGSPFPVTYGIIDGLAFFNPTMPPAGANDPSITVTPEHPLPIILVNGTTATQGTNWSVGAPVLANAGYKVYTFNYGNTTSDPTFPIQAIGDIRQSGEQLAAEVDRVLAETGAEKVILVGHSQGGGILAVHYINNLGGASKVSQLIGIDPSNHGTDLMGLVSLASLPIVGPLLIQIADAIGPGLYQQALGSPFQDVVYGDGDTRPGILYTTIASVNDEVVTPYTQSALTGPNVTNIVVQDRYPGLVLGHANIFLSPQVWTLVLDALASNPQANPLQTPDTVAA